MVVSRKYSTSKTNPFPFWHQTQRRGTDERELQRLGGVLRDLRDARVAESQEMASRWDEEKFAAPRRCELSVPHQCLDLGLAAAE